MSAHYEAEAAETSRATESQNISRVPLETESFREYTEGPNGHSEVFSYPPSRDGFEEGFIHDDRDLHRQTDGTSHVDSSVPSNEKLLGTAFISFMSFALVQMFFAFVADSEAMKGDSAAMIVDALTYLFNWIAEHKKNAFDWDGTRVNSSGTQFNLLQNSETQNGTASADPAILRRLRKREYRKMVLQMEILPPLLSVSTLLVVTIVVTYKAILVLMGIKRSRSSSSHPNLALMMGFSIFNLGLDMLNVFCFARAKHLMGYTTLTKEQRQQQRHANDLATGRSAQGYALPNESSPTSPHNSGSPTSAEGDQLSTTANIQNPNGSATLTDDSEHSADDEEDRPNLNMCSAYTHVFADTLRSLAVILAATIAELLPVVTPLEADATAAIAVSVLIALSLLPLFQGLTESISELREIQGEERSETILEQAGESDGVLS